MHSSVGASWWERDAPFSFWTSVLPHKEVGRTHRASRQDADWTGQLPRKCTEQLTTEGNEKESPLSGLQKLYLTEAVFSIRDAVL